MGHKSNKIIIAYIPRTDFESLGQPIDTPRGPRYPLDELYVEPGQPFLYVPEDWPPVKVRITIEEVE